MTDSGTNPEESEAVIATNPETLGTAAAPFRQWYGMHSKRQVFLPAIGAREDPEDIYIYTENMFVLFLLSRERWMGGQFMARSYKLCFVSSHKLCGSVL